MKKQTDLRRLLIITRQHAETVYNIELEKLQRDREKYARNGEKYAQKKEKITKGGKLL